MELLKSRPITKLQRENFRAKSGEIFISLILHLILPRINYDDNPICPQETQEFESVLRWQQIQKAFSQPITTSKEFESRVKSYNPQFRNAWRFSLLHSLLSVSLMMTD